MKDPEKGLPTLCLAEPAELQTKYGEPMSFPWQRYNDHTLTLASSISPPTTKGNVIPTSIKMSGYAYGGCYHNAHPRTLWRSIFAFLSRVPTHLTSDQFPSYSIVDDVYNRNYEDT